MTTVKNLGFRPHIGDYFFIWDGFYEKAIDGMAVSVPILGIIFLSRRYTR